MKRSDIRILVVDDQEDGRLLLDTLLTSEGYQVRQAVDGEQALDIARQWHPQVVISDILMPNMDGFMLCHEIKKDAALRDIAFIFYTATYKDSDDEKLGLALGASRFIHKPADTTEFLAIIEETIDDYQAGRLKPGAGAQDTEALDHLHARAVTRKLDEKIRALQAEQTAHGKTLERLELAFRGANDGLWDWDLRTDEVYYSPRWKSMLGYGEPEITHHLDSFRELLHPEDHELAWSSVDDYLHGRRDRLEVEFRLRHKDGHYVDILSRGFCLRDARGEPCRIVGTHVDISERKRYEQELLRLNRVHAILSTCNHILVRAVDKQELFQGFCDSITSIGEYHFAWIGLRDEDGRIHPRAWAGTDDGCLDFIRIRNEGFAPDAPVFSGALLTGRPAISNPADDAQHQDDKDTHCLLPRISLPLISAGTTLGILGICAAEPDRFHEDEIELLTELSDDLAFGLQSLRNESARQLAEDNLRLKDRAIESSINGIVITDARAPDHPIAYANRAFLKITGYSGQEVIGKNPRFLLRGELDQPGLDDIRAALRAQRPATTVVRSYRKDGSLFWNDMRISPVFSLTGELTHYIGILNDVTEQVRYQEELERQSNYDSLTGLANRNLLQDRMRQAVAFADRHEQMVAILLIDIDRFKQLNDTFGHGSGDALLRDFAQRLSEHTRRGDSVARISGDEFVVLLTDIADETALNPKIRALQAALKQPFTLNGQDVFISSSIGVSLYPRDGNDEEQLLRHADMAMYRSRELGGDNYQYFEPGMSALAHERLSLEIGLRRALERKELYLAYQPQYEILSGRLAGAEVLLRWNSGTHGNISPAQFIPVAENTGLINAIGKWVLEEACLRMGAWRRAGLGLDRISVNISCLQVRQEGFVEMVRAALEAAQVDPGMLELEVTESVMLEYTEQTARALLELSNLGVTMAIDDFGTGYSSLSYLNRLPVHALKIDKSFINDILVDPNDAAIARAIIALGQSLDLRVIAEGVETRAQYHMLNTLDCHEAQGFFFSHPLREEDFERLLQDASSNHALTEKHSWRDDAHPD